MVTIFGKDSCPYTVAARDDSARRGIEIDCVNVKRSPEGLSRILEISGGKRQVPVIVGEGCVTVGFGGT
jgi:glutaredoxin 3